MHFPGRHNRYPQLLDPKKYSKYISKLQSIQYRGSEILIFSTSQKLTDYYWINITDNSIPFVVFINHTKLCGEETYNGKYVYYAGAYVENSAALFESSEQEKTREIFSSVKRMFPEFDEKLVSESRLIRLKDAQHIIDIEYAEKVPEYNTPISSIYLVNGSQLFKDERTVNSAIRFAKEAINNFHETVAQDG